MSRDPVREFERHDYEQQTKLEKFPVCSNCGEHIQQETAVYINGEWYCDDCLSDCRLAIEEDM